MYVQLMEMQFLICSKEFGYHYRDHYRDFQFSCLTLSIIHLSITVVSIIMAGKLKIKLLVEMLNCSCSSGTEGRRIVQESLSTMESEKLHRMLVAHWHCQN